MRALARMTRQPEKRQVQTRGRHILFHFFRRLVFANFRAHLGHEASHGLLIALGRLKDALGRLHPAVQPLLELRDVRGGVFGKSKVRQKQTLWLALQNPGEGGIPERQVDIRWRRGRHHVRVPFDAYPRRVAHEGDALEVLEIADVVRGVAGRVSHLDFARAERNRLATFEDSQIRFRHGQRFTEQLGEIVRPKPRRACQQLRRIDHVWRAEFVDVHRHSRVFPDERAASACVVQVNVRQQKRVQVAHRNAARAKLFPQRMERGSRTRIDNRVMPVRFEQSRADRTRPSHPMVIEGGDLVHASPRK